MNHSNKTNKRPLLSFCIFTYNQPDAVRRVLERVIPQTSSDVEILIRDDSADDRTENVVKSFSGFENLRYFRGQKEGVDKAIIFLLKEAKGKYFWGFGDDDLDPDAISKVLDVVRRSPETMLVITNCREAGSAESAFRIGPSRFFRNPEEVLVTFSDIMNYVSILIYKREIAITGVEGMKPFIGSACASFYMALYMLSKGGRYYFLDYPCVIPDVRNPDEKLWYDPFEVHAVNVFSVAKSFRGNFNKKALKKMTTLTFRSVWRGMLVQRAQGRKNGFGFSYSKVAKILKLYWNFPEFWLALPFFCMPKFFLRFTYRLYKVVFPRTQARVAWRSKQQYPSLRDKWHRNLFRFFFPKKSEIDFPAGYIPNRFFLNQIDKGPVLVVGDYRGRDYSAIKEKIKEVYLLDIVDNGIADNKFFILQSITERIKFPDNYFRYVVIAEVIEHVWEDKIALKELHRILSPEGKLLMSVPLFHDFADHHYHIYSPRTILILLKHSGFSMIKAQYKGLAVAIPNEIIALAALLLFPIFGAKALLKVNKFFYRLHLLFSGQKKFNSIFRFKYPFLRGYGVIIEAAKSNEVIDSVQVQKDSFSLKKNI